MARARERAGGGRLTAVASGGTADRGRLAPGTLAVALGVLFGLTAMSASALAVALPALAGDLGVSRAASAWVLSGYALTLAVTTALHGRIADLVGIRRPFVVGIALMAGGAVASALAPSLGVLIAARLVQGAGAAAIPVLATDLLSSRFDGAVRSAALARLAGVGAAGSALGPLLGGVLESLGGWRPAAALPALALLLVPVVWRNAPARGEGGALDLRGAAVVAAAGAGLVLLIQSPAAGAVVGVAGAALAAAGGAATWRHVRARPTGFLPRAVVGNRVVMAAALAAASCPVGWFALLLAVPALLTDHGWSTLGIGLGLVPSAVVAVVLSRYSSGLLERAGERRTLATGALTAVAALLVAAAGSAADAPLLLLLSVALVTVAFGLGQPAMISAVGASVDPGIRGIALGVATFVFLTGAGVGSAAFGGLPELLGATGTFVALAALPAAGAVAVRALLPARLG